MKFRFHFSHLLYPPLIVYLILVSILPFVFLLLAAFAQNDAAGMFSWDLRLDNFRELFGDSFYVGRMFYTLCVALGVTLVTLGLAVPFTFLILELGHFWRTTWLVALFSSLALSEVLAVYAWQILLSKSTGLPGWLALLGLVSGEESWWPGLGAMLVVLVYYTLPVAIIILFPAFTRLDPALREVARTMGLSSWRAAIFVTLPAIREPVTRTAMLCFLLNIGGFVVSQQLGRPSDWMYSVFIADFVSSFNVPLAVTMSLMLLAVAVCALFVFALLGRETRHDTGGY